MEGSPVEERTEAVADPAHPGRSWSTKKAERKHNPSITTTTSPPDLLRVVTAWERLPEAVRFGIVAMVKAATRK